MTDKFKMADLGFRKYAGMDMMTAMKVLMEKGITTNDIENITVKLFEIITEEVNKKNLDGNYKSLFHLVMSYFIFIGAITAYDEWIKEAAAEHNLKPEKYIKIIFSL